MICLICSFMSIIHRAKVELTFKKVISLPSCILLSFLPYIPICILSISYYLASVNEAPVNLKLFGSGIGRGHTLCIVTQMDLLNQQFLLMRCWWCMKPWLNLVLFNIYAVFCVSNCRVQDSGVVIALWEMQTVLLLL